MGTKLDGTVTNQVIMLGSVIVYLDRFGLSYKVNICLGVRQNHWRAPKERQE